MGAVVLRLDFAGCLIADFIEHRACALVGGRLFHGRDDVVVVEVFLAEDEDMRAALVLAGAAVLAVIAVAAVLSLSCLLFFGCNAVSLFGIGGQSPFDFEIVAKLGHEVVHVVHFLHHQALL